MLGENVAKIRTDLMKEQLTTFRSQLEDFARKHKVLFSLMFDIVLFLFLFDFYLYYKFWYLVSTAFWIGSFMGFRKYFLKLSGKVKNLENC